MRIIYIPRRSVVIDVPTVTTDSVTSITSTTAVSGGNVTSDGGAEVTEYGVEWSLTSDFSSLSGYTSDGSGLGSFVSDLTGLSPNTLYYVRAYAVNSAGTGYGGTESFTSEAAGTLAQMFIQYVYPILRNSAEVTCEVRTDGGSTVTERGAEWSLYSDFSSIYGSDSSGSGTGTYSINMTGLSASTTYYVRAYGINSVGTAYSSVTSFTTTP